MKSTDKNPQIFYEAIIVKQLSPMGLEVLELVRFSHFWQCMVDPTDGLLLMFLVSNVCLLKERKVNNIFKKLGLRITSDHGIDPSRVLKNRYDQNKCAIEIMQHTSKTNYEQLQQIPLRTPVPLHLLDEGLTVTRESTLADILDYGINNEDSATDIFCYFRRELNLVTEYS